MSYALFCQQFPPYPNCHAYLTSNLNRSNFFQMTKDSSSHPKFHIDSFLFILDSREQFYFLNLFIDTNGQIISRMIKTSRKTSDEQYWFYVSMNTIYDQPQILGENIQTFQRFLCVKITHIAGIVCELYKLKTKQREKNSQSEFLFEQTLDSNIYEKWQKQIKQNLKYIKLTEHSFISYMGVINQSQIDEDSIKSYMKLKNLEREKQSKQYHKTILQEIRNSTFRFFQPQDTLNTMIIRQKIQKITKLMIKIDSEDLKLLLKSLYKLISIKSKIIFYQQEQYLNKKQLYWIYKMSTDTFKRYKQNVDQDKKYGWSKNYKDIYLSQLSKLDAFNVKLFFYLIIGHDIPQAKLPKMHQYFDPNNYQELQKSQNFETQVNKSFSSNASQNDSLSHSLYDTSGEFGFDKDYGDTASCP